MNTEYFGLMGDDIDPIEGNMMKLDEATASAYGEAGINDWYEWSNGTDECWEYSAREWLRNGDKPASDPLTDEDINTWLEGVYAEIDRIKASDWFANA